VNCTKIALTRSIIFSPKFNDGRLAATGSAQTRWELKCSPAPLAVAGEEVEIEEGIGKGGERKEGRRREREERARNGKLRSEVFKSRRLWLIPVMIITYFYKVQNNRKNGAGCDRRPAVTTSETRRCFFHHQSHVVRVVMFSFRVDLQ